MSGHDYSILYHSCSIENPFEVLFHEYDQKMEFFDMHYEVEIGIVLEGRLMRDYGNCSFEYLPGEVWLHGSWEPHRCLLEETPCKVIVVVINPVFLASCDLPLINWNTFFSMPPESRKETNTEFTRNEIKRISNQIQEISNSNDSLKPIRLKTIVSEILLLLMGKVKIEDNQITEHPQATEKIQAAINLVFTSNAKLSIDEAAQKCNMSKSAFTAIFQQYMGISFHKFALRYRLNRAAIELKKTDVPISGIAEKWGFTDLSHFTHSFTAHYMITPNNYRKGIDRF